MSGDLDGLLRELGSRPALSVLRSPAELEPLSRDFGRVQVRAPAAALRISGGREAGRALGAARCHGVPVRVRGAGFSAGGPTLCRDGLILVHCLEEAPCVFREGGRVEIPAGSRWAAVMEALRRRGRSVPVLTTNPQATVGGTLTGGGFGPRSVALGAQVDHVRSVELVLPDGQSRHCSPSENPDLFRYGLAGMGPLGVVRRIVLDTVPSRPWARVQVNTFAALPALARLLVAAGWGTGAEPDYFLATGGQGEWRAVTARTFPSWREAAFAPPPAPEGFPPGKSFYGPSEILDRGDAPSPLAEGWQSHLREGVVEASRFEALACFAQECCSLSPEGVQPCSRVLCLRGPAPGPRFPFDPRAAPVQFGLLLGFTFRPGGRREQWVQAALTAFLDRVASLGGRPDLAGAPPQDGAFPAGYGDDYRRLQALRRSLDPGGLFLPPLPEGGLP